MPAGDPSSSPGGQQAPKASWLSRAYTTCTVVVAHLVKVLEATLVLSIALIITFWITYGGYQYGVTYNWSLSTFLALIDERWKGVLILGSLLILGPTRDFIRRVKKATVPGGLGFDTESTAQESKTEPAPQRQHT